MNRRTFVKAVSALAFEGRRTHRLDWGATDQGKHHLATTFNVRDFGARGDGKTDDSAAFRQTLARAAQKGGSVRVPPGTYRVREILQVRDGVWLEGMGQDSIIEHFGEVGIVIALVNTANSGVHDLHIAGKFAFGVVVERSSRVVVRKCSIRGGTLRSSPSGYCGGIFVTESNDVTLEENDLDGNGVISDGVLSADIQVNGFGKNISSRNIQIVANRCRSTSTQCCICAYDIQQSGIRRNTCAGAKTGRGNNNGYGILVYQRPESPGSCLENTVADNHVSETQGSAIYLQQSHRSQVLRNSIERVANLQADHSLPVGGVALNQSQYVVVADNRIAQSRRAGISVASNRQDVGRVEIRDNSISGTGGLGIHLRGLLTDIRVFRNTLTSCNGGIGSLSRDAQDRLQIVENTVSDTVGLSPGIILGNAGQTIVRDNVISDAGGRSLDLTLQDIVSDVANNVVLRRGAPPAIPDDVRVVRSSAF